MFLNSHQWQLAFPVPAVFLPEGQMWLFSWCQKTVTCPALGPSIHCPCLQEMGSSEVEKEVNIEDEQALSDLSGKQIPCWGCNTLLPAGKGHGPPVKSCCGAPRWSSQACSPPPAICLWCSWPLSPHPASCPSVVAELSLGFSSPWQPPI